MALGCSLALPVSWTLCTWPTPSGTCSQYGSGTDSRWASGATCSGQGRLMCTSSVVLPPSQALAFDDIVTPGALLAVSNLSYRGHAHQLPTATAGDGCIFSQNPKEPHLRQALTELQSSLPVSGGGGQCQS